MNKQEEQIKTKTELPAWAALAIIIILIIVVGAVFYFQFMRFYLVGEAINKGDLVSSALLLSPEISAGITNVMSSL